MAGSTYSSNLKIELMSTGENAGTWGNITNTNLGTALEQAVVGLGNPDFVADADLTITITNSNAAQAARALVLNVTSAFGSLTATRELVVPTSQKQYIVQNNTAGDQSITVKTSGGTGITVPNGRKAHLYVDGTNVVQMFDFVDINGGAIDGTTVGAAAASTGAFTNLSASGTLGVTGVATLGVGAVLNTPASVTLTNATGLPISTGVSGLGTGVATFLGTPSSANLAAAVTDETGTGALVFANSPTLVTPALGTPASGVVTNLTGTASININGTVGATTASTGAFTTLSATGVTTVQAGTVSAPAITTTGDTNTGIFFPAADTIAFAEGGAEAGRFDSSGNFLVGTTDNLPATNNVAAGIALRADGNAQFSRASAAVARFNRGSDGEIVSFNKDGVTVGVIGAASGGMYFGSGSSGTERMRITSTGNVGIGTSSPARQFEVIAANAPAAQFVRTTTATNSLQTNPVVIARTSGDMVDGFGTLVNHQIQDDAGVDNTIGYYGFVRNGADNSGAFYVSTANAGTPAERMRIDSAGNVGIGTTSPTEKLQVAGSIRVTSNASDFNVTGGQFDFITDTVRIAAYNSAGGYVTFYTNASGGSVNERARIDPSGNLLVGASAVGNGGKLYVNGSISLGTSTTGAQSSMAKDTTQLTTSVSTSATTIYTDISSGMSSASAGYFIIYGSNNAGAGFMDVVIAKASGTPVVVSSSTVEGSPAARTYSVSSSALQLTMASGTFNINLKATVLGHPF
jgi:hypothetical protein